MVSPRWMVFIDGRAVLTFSNERLLSSLPQLTFSSPSDRDIHRKVPWDFLPQSSSNSCMLNGHAAEKENEGPVEQASACCSPNQNMQHYQCCGSKLELSSSSSALAASSPRFCYGPRASSNCQLSAYIMQLQLVSPSSESPGSRTKQLSNLRSVLLTQKKKSWAHLCL